MLFNSGSYVKKNRRLLQTHFGSKVVFPNCHFKLLEASETPDPRSGDSLPAIERFTVTSELITRLD